MLAHCLLPSVSNDVYTTRKATGSIQVVDFTAMQLIIKLRRAYWLVQTSAFHIFRTALGGHIQQIFILLFQRLSSSKTTKYVKGKLILSAIVLLKFLSICFVFYSVSAYLMLFGKHVLLSISATFFQEYSSGFCILIFEVQYSYSSFRVVGLSFFIRQ